MNHCPSSAWGKTLLENELRSSYCNTSHTTYNTVSFRTWRSYTGIFNIRSSLYSIRETQHPQAPHKYIIRESERPCVSKKVRAFIAQDGDDLLAHLLGREDASGGAEGEDLSDHLLLVEVVVENRERVDAVLLVE